MPYDSNTELAVRSIQRLTLIRESAGATVWISHDSEDWGGVQARTSLLRVRAAMSVLVDYWWTGRCKPHEVWVPRPSAPARCERAGRRRFRGALLRSTPGPAPNPAVAAAAGPTICQRPPTG